MKTAIISDIHANLEALTAVLEHIDAQGNVDRIWCLGDIVGYGPDPREVIDLIQEKCDWTLLGNHDHAMLNSPDGFNYIAAGAIECQKRLLDPEAKNADDESDLITDRERRWEFLQSLQEKIIVDGSLFVHASPRDPIFEYIVPQDTLVNQDKIDSVFRCVDTNCYIGHTHQPGVITEEPCFYRPEDVSMEYPFYPGEKLIINVSSVGQPRDHNPRACYVTITEEKVMWHRVEYDVEKTIQKVLDDSCLDDRCGLRLRDGR